MRSKSKGGKPTKNECTDQRGAFWDVGFADRSAGWSRTFRNWWTGLEKLLVDGLGTFQHGGPLVTFQLQSHHSSGMAIGLLIKPGKKLVIKFHRESVGIKALLELPMAGTMVFVIWGAWYQLRKGGHWDEGGWTAEPRVNGLTSVRVETVLDCALLCCFGVRRMKAWRLIWDGV